jgi:hypothetical protein
VGSQGNSFILKMLFSSYLNIIIFYDTSLLLTLITLEDLFSDRLNEK